MIRRVGRVVMLVSNAVAPDVRVVKEAQALSKRGNDVIILAWDRESAHAATQSCPTHRVERFAIRSSYGRCLRQGLGLLRFSRKCIRRIQELQPSIVHAHDLEMFPAALIAARRTRARLLFDAHEPEYFANAAGLHRIAAPIGRLAERLFAPLADAVVTTNAYQADKYRRFGAQNVTIVANYPELELVPCAKEGAGERPLAIGRVGAILHNAGIEELAQAHKVLQQDYPDLRLLIAGRATPVYKQRLTSFLQQLGSSAEVSWTYNYQEMAHLYAQLDLVVLPTHQNRWYRHITPTKLFEAMAHGKPILATDVGPVKETLLRYGCGIVLADSEPSTLTRCIGGALADLDQLRAMGERGRQAILTELNWEQSVARLLAAYDGLEGGRPSSHAVGAAA